MSTFTTHKETFLKVVRTMKKKAFIVAIGIYYGSSFKRYLKGLEQSLKIFNESVGEEITKSLEAINTLGNKNLNILIANCKNKDVQIAIAALLTEGMDITELETIKKECLKLWKSPTIKSEIANHIPIWEKVIADMRKDAERVMKIYNKLT